VAAGVDPRLANAADLLLCGRRDPECCQRSVMALSDVISRAAGHEVEVAFGSAKRSVPMHLKVEVQLGVLLLDPRHFDRDPPHRATFAS
jgi:hypothetical protein